MAKYFHLSVAKVAETLYEGEALSLTAPGEEGVLTVLAHHEALVTPLKHGTLRFETGSGEVTEITIDRGILEISDNQATVLL
jgi:F-type H+-transporting ATPase subunit epsilon